MWGYSLGELFQRGGIVMWPLLVFSLAALAIVLERTTTLVLLATPYDHFINRLRSALDGGRTTEAAKQLLRPNRSPLARVAETYLERLDCESDVLHEQVAHQASRQLARMERRLHWLSVIGTLAPMLGLLGTVMGLVEAFHQIETLGGQLQPGDLAAGIWKALLTTVYGLIIGLPALGAFQLLDHRVSTVALQMQWLTTFLNERFGKPGQTTSVSSEQPVAN